MTQHIYHVYGYHRSQNPYRVVSKYVHRPHLKVNHTCMHVGVGVVHNYQQSTPGLLACLPPPPQETVLRYMYMYIIISVPLIMVMP